MYHILYYFLIAFCFLCGHVCIIFCIISLLHVVSVFSVTVCVSYVVFFPNHFQFSQWPCVYHILYYFIISFSFLSGHVCIIFCIISSLLLVFSVVNWPCVYHIL